MNFLLAIRNRLIAVREQESGFTLIEILVSIALTLILFNIIGSTVATVNQIFMPTVQSVNNANLEPAKVAAGEIYQGIERFKHDYPDTTPTHALVTTKGYVAQPSNVVWAFHTYGGPANREMCVIAYIDDGSTTGYTSYDPAAYDSSYQYKSIGQSCRHQESGSSTNIPNWDSE